MVVFKKRSALIWLTMAVHRFAQLKERGVEKSEKQQSTFHPLRLGTICVQPDRHWHCFEGNLGKLLNEGAVGVWAFLRAAMLFWAEGDWSYWLGIKHHLPVALKENWSSLRNFWTPLQILCHGIDLARFTYIYISVKQRNEGVFLEDILMYWMCRSDCFDGHFKCRTTCFFAMASEPRH